MYICRCINLTLASGNGRKNLTNAKLCENILPNIHWLVKAAGGKFTIQCTTHLRQFRAICRLKLAVYESITSNCQCTAIFNCVLSLIGDWCFYLNEINLMFHVSISFCFFYVIHDCSSALTKQKKNHMKSK